MSRVKNAISTSYYEAVHLGGVCQRQRRVVPHRRDTARFILTTSSNLADF